MNNNEKEVDQTSDRTSSAVTGKTSSSRALQEAFHSLNPLRRYSPNEQAMRLVVLAVVLVIGMGVGFCVAALIGIDISVSLVLAILTGAAFAALTAWYFNLSSAPPPQVSEQPMVESDPLMEVSPDDMTMQYITPSPITVRLAEKNQRNLPPGANPTKWLLPADLESTLYDDRHHGLALRQVLIMMFTRDKEGKTKNLSPGTRALTNLFSYWLVLSVVVLIAGATAFGYDTSRELATTAAGFTVVFACTVTYGAYYCLTHVRLVVTKRITAEIHDTWPWAPKRLIYIYSATLTESTYEQGFFARLFRFSHHRIETTEQKPMLTSWHYARNPTRLDYALNSVNPKAHMFQE